MRLIRCSIENFGKLNKFDIEFTDGFNSIKEENGFGKSTLAVFIRVMLYGFNNERSRSDIDNERKRYRPWNNGVYGGTLIVEAGGRQYNITRHFGNKEKEDECQIRDVRSNRIIDELSDNFGTWLFKIDSASFERTAFITNGNCETEITDDIDGMLGNILDRTCDNNNYSEIVAGMDNRLNKLSPSRKTGSLYKLKSELETIKVQLREESLLTDELDNQQSRIIALEKRKRELKEEQRLLKNQVRICENTNQSKNLTNTNQISGEEERLDNNESVFDVILLFGILLIGVGVIVFKYIDDRGIIASILGICFVYFRLKNRLHKSYNYNIEELESDSDGNDDLHMTGINLEDIYGRIEDNLSESEDIFNELAKISQGTKDIMNRLKSLDRLRLKYNDLKIDYDNLLEEYRILEKTRMYFLKTKEQIGIKYNEPVMQCFNKYYGYISGTYEDQYFMDSDGKVTVLEYGMQRNTAILSKGYRDIIGICMRISLLEVMYKNEKPFILFDDPFVNLDDQKYESAMDLLKRLAGEYQVIYLSARSR